MADVAEDAEVCMHSDPAVVSEELAQPFSGSKLRVWFRGPGFARQKQGPRSRSRKLCWLRPEQGCGRHFASKVSDAVSARAQAAKQEIGQIPYPVSYSHALPFPILFHSAFQTLSMTGLTLCSETSVLQMPPARVLPPWCVPFVPCFITSQFDTQTTWTRIAARFGVHLQEDVIWLAVAKSPIMFLGCRALFDHGKLI